MKRGLGILAIALLLMHANSVYAVKIADITHIGGQRTNVMIGMGLVVGLKGTGDGGDYMGAIRMLAELHGKFQNHVDVKELANAANVAVVTVHATIPSNGVHNGDTLDCYVDSCGAASSLKGGRLLPTLMCDTEAKFIWALSEGQIEFQDQASPNTGFIKQGCVMEATIEQKFVNDNGQFTLIIENPVASWTTASRIAQIINGSEAATGETLAVAVDPKSVQVTIPKIERDHPDSFISRVQRLQISASMLVNEARVLITARSKSIVITGDVEISPVVISHNGLTITTVSPPQTRGPQVVNHTAVALDTTNEGGAKLQDLVNAMDQLKVSADDRIAIIEELYDTGKLHAKLVIEGQP